ncbi:TPA: DnaD domain protein, partial [Enterococcus faecium]|nr:DnaD domain protein [Enterococcus faecium]
EFIQKNWGKSPTGLLQGALGPMIKTWGADMILFAFKLAFENNVEMPGLKKYVEAILNSWSNQGIKTMESAEKAQEAFKNKKKQNYLPKRQNNVRREKLPDWVNKPQEEKTLDPDKKAELEARFAAYQAKKEALLENE